MDKPCRRSCLWQHVAQESSECSGRQSERSGGVRLHIIGFALGTLCATAGVAVVAVAMGFPGSTVFKLAAASFVLAQFLYIAWVAAMARFEARRRKLQGSDEGSAPPKPAQGVVQKG